MKPTYEKLEKELAAAVAAERVWETTMMEACGEDGPDSVAAEIKSLREQVRQLTEQRDAVVVECQSKKSALEAILEHCPVNHPHTDAACAAMIAHDNLYCVETPATSAILDSLRAEGVEMFAADQKQKFEERKTGDASRVAVSYHACVSAYAEDFARQLREKTNAELAAAIREITSNWSIRGPYHESDLPFYALLNDEWVGDGYETRRQALIAILRAVESKGAQS